ncbi:MAG: DoxX family protein [Acidobacteriaceae bacterium]
MNKLVSTPNDYTLSLLRLILGIVFFAHGSQLVLGWYGGLGFSTSMGIFTHTLGIPALFAFLAIMAQFLGGIGLIVGLLGRVAAFGIMIDMLVAIFMVHLPNGFFMNWYGNQKGEGYEYHLLVIAIAITLLVKGSGALSLDRLLTKKS